MRRNIALLGSTGSIGTQSLAVCENLGLGVAALAARSNLGLLERQARRWKPRIVAVFDKDSYQPLKTSLADLDCRVLAGEEGVCEAAACEGADTVVNAVVGIAGLRPTLAALGAGKQLALANKESLVTGGKLVMAEAARRKKSILPIDSEHSAILQCLQAGDRRELRGVVLTASGGPFFGKGPEELREVTVKEALAHPNWKMGAKITVDSATLMNKGLEFIEAMWLFGLSPGDIEVVVHRQSVIHSAVEFCDGSVIAQMGVPDMRLAIQYALTYPRHERLDCKRLSLIEYGALTFEKPDPGTFSCLDVCMRVARAGGLGPAVANGANEQAVSLFLDGKIGFLRIGELVAQAVESVRAEETVTLQGIFEADAQAREYVLAHYGR